jgi:hypothetical protein
MPAPKNNKNATKPEADKSSTWLQVRCTEDQKKQWKTCAKTEGMTLSEWVVAMLDT